MQLAPQQHAISVHYAVADGSAVLGTNYTVSQAASGTLTFAPGNTAKTVTVTGVDDGVYLAGAGKTFTLTLSSPQGAAIAGSASSTGTINDADTAPQMGISSCPTGQVNGGGLAVFPIRVQAASVPATVTYTTVGVNTLPGDFDGGTGTVTIPPGTGSAVRQFDLKIPTHAIAPAGSRIFDVQLSSPQGARLSTSLAPCTIVSSGSAASTVPTLQITNPVPVVEPASGSTSVPVTVTLNPPAAQTTPTDVHIHWQTADGSATQPADYATGSGDLTWAAGTYGPQTFSVQVNSNQARTAQGTFTIAFTSPDSSAGFLGAPTATVTVLPVGSTASVLSIADASAPEKQGAIPVVVTLTPTAVTPVTVDYATADGSGAKGAFAGTDYTAKSGTLTFSPGQSTQTISIAITPYSLVEPNKSFQVVLSNPVGATLANSTATVTILNDNVRAHAPADQHGRHAAPEETGADPHEAHRHRSPGPRRHADGREPRERQGPGDLPDQLPRRRDPALRRHGHLRRPCPGEAEEGLEEEARSDQRPRGQRHVQRAHREDGQRRDQADEAGPGAAQVRQAPEGEGDDQREGRCRRQGPDGVDRLRRRPATDREEADGEEEIASVSAPSRRTRAARGPNRPAR